MARRCQNSFQKLGQRGELQRDVGPWAIRVGHQKLSFKRGPSCPRVAEKSRGMTPGQDLGIEVIRYVQAAEGVGSWESNTVLSMSRRVALKWEEAGRIKIRGGL